MTSQSKLVSDTIADHRWLTINERRITGDSNVDGVYRSSTFETGDWNGDREFDSADLVFLFSAGTYSTPAARLIAAAVDADRLIHEQRAETNVRSPRFD
ncbi:MAG: hypothetical protein KDB27_13090 [Planctomycetales bacterium]|nr:hypothetical protein [Planctomycetales bacterium]